MHGGDARLDGPCKCNRSTVTDTRSRLIGTAPLPPHHQPTPRRSSLPSAMLKLTLKTLASIGDRKHLPRLLSAMIPLPADWNDKFASEEMTRSDLIYAAGASSDTTSSGYRCAAGAVVRAGALLSYHGDISRRLQCERQFYPFLHVADCRSDNPIAAAASVTPRGRNVPRRLPAAHRHDPLSSSAAVCWCADTAERACDCSATPPRTFRPWV